PPRRIVIDNGKDYDSYANNGLTKQQRRRLASSGEDWSEHAAGRGLFGMLGIDVHFALPYNHNGKSRIERWHRTLHAEFDAEFDSYCGAKPGDVELPRGFFKDAQRLVSMDEVRRRLPKFVDWYNNRSDHFMDDLADEQGRKLSPTEAMNSWRDTRTIMPRPEALALLMHRWEPPRTVGKLGIGVRIDGRTLYYGQDAIELRPLQGRKKGVQVTYDPADMSRVFVYDTQFRFICTAQANSMHGGNSPVSRAALKAALKRQRDHEKAVRDSLRDGHMSLMTAADIAREEQEKIDADRRAERAREGIGVENDNQQLRIVRTPVDDQLPEVQREEMRKAAGAESMQKSELDFTDVVLPGNSGTEEEHSDLDFSGISFEQPVEREGESVMGGLAFWEAIDDER
ncbi:MAG: transposase, partial [Phycisphaerales bacterium]|nr:transposase [Phycisphaerales bacterium]